MSQFGHLSEKSIATDTSIDAVDAVQLLCDQHREVEALFDQIEKAADGNVQDRADLFSATCGQD